MMEGQQANNYAVYAEIEGSQEPLLLLDLTFARLIDNVIFPYQSERNLVIDGVPISPMKIKKINILKFRESYCEALLRFNYTLARASFDFRNTYKKQYSSRFEHILRSNSDDVTSQVMKTFNQVVEPNIDNYLYKREGLIFSATRHFTENIKPLGS